MFEKKNAGERDDRFWSPVQLLQISLLANGLTDLTEIWNQDFLGDDAYLNKYLHSEKSDQAPLIQEGDIHVQVQYRVIFVI